MQSDKDSERISAATKLKHGTASNEQYILCSASLVISHSCMWVRDIRIIELR